MSALLQTYDLSLHAGDRHLVDDLALTLQGGQITVVLGTNGAGKTTLLETLCGLSPPASGTLDIDGQPLGNYRPRELAMKIGLMPQRQETGFDYTVEQRVALARFAHGGLWQWRADEDMTAAGQSLEQVGMAEFAKRGSATLSGGEQQRVALAMLLAQAPSLLCLDEPFSQLDPRHQRRTCALLRAQRDAGRGVVLSVHDMNVAAELADQVVLLYGDGRWRQGPADDILTTEHLSQLYATPVARVSAPGGGALFTFL